MNEIEPIDWGYTPLPEEEELEEEDPFPDFHQRYVLGFDPAPLDEVDIPFEPGGFMMGYCEADVQFTEEVFRALTDVSDASAVVADSIQSFAERITRMGEVTTGIRNSLNNREYNPPMSSDAMWVSYSDGREERPL